MSEFQGRRRLDVLDDIYQARLLAEGYKLAEIFYRGMDCGRAER